MDESWQDQEDPPQDVEMVSSTSVAQSHAIITSSIEETHASKQTEQSIPMNYPSKEFTQMHRRKLNDILTCDNVERYSLAWKI